VGARGQRATFFAYYLRRDLKFLLKPMAPNPPPMPHHKPDDYLPSPPSRPSRWLPRLECDPPGAVGATGHWTRIAPRPRMWAEAHLQQPHSTLGGGVPPKESEKKIPPK